MCTYLNFDFRYEKQYIVVNQLPVLMDKITTETMTDKPNMIKFKSKRGRKKLVLSNQEKIERRLQVSKLSLFLSFIAVYIDSLVMISIERSETNKKRALEIRDKFVSDHEFCHRLGQCLSRTMTFVTDWANTKSMAKIQYKFHGLRQI